MLTHCFMAPDWHYRKHNFNGRGTFFDRATDFDCNSDAVTDTAKASSH